MRDGLQSLKKVYTYNTKLKFIDILLKSNLKNIEFGSTTNPKLLPQMNNSYDIWNYIKEYKNKKNLTMLITDNNSLEKCIEEKIISFGLLSSVCDSFGLSNLKKNSIDSLKNIIYQINMINNYNHNSHIRLYLSCSFGSNKEIFNDLYLNKLFNYVADINYIIKMYNYKNVEIVLCDTTGNLNNEILEKTLKKITTIHDINKYIALHMHCNNNFNDYIDIALKYNIYKFDSSLLNIGGCPFTGKSNLNNINTVQLVEYLENKNYDTGIDINNLKNIEKQIYDIMNE
jgi:hydroxymethylglutaryl-CoA lyase